jgi:DNA-binding NarL/FixJ family response regulator
LKVFIAEESPIVSARLVAMLSEIEGISILGFAHTVPQAAAVMRAGLPDVAVVGFHYPLGSTRELLRLVREETPKTIVMVLANHAADFAQQYKEAGAAFVFDKITELDVMIDILTLMCTGRTMEEPRADIAQVQQQTK